MDTLLGISLNTLSKMMADDTTKVDVIKPTPIANLINVLTQQKVLDDRRKSGERRISERAIACAVSEMATQNNDSTISPSHFTRLLNGGGVFDLKTVRYIGAYAASVLSHKYTNLNETVAADAVLAEYVLWKNEILDSSENEEVNQPIKLRGNQGISAVRSPVSRIDRFRKAAIAVLDGENQLIIIAAGNEKKISRSAFAQSVALYCAYDAPLDRRRTLLTADLAELHFRRTESQKEHDRNVELLAGRVSASLGVTRRSGGVYDSVTEIVTGIVNALQYVTRPLLFLPNGRRIPDPVLADFLRRLFIAIPQNSKIKVLMAAESDLKIQVPANEDGKPETTVSTTSFDLPYMAATELSAHLIWELNLEEDQKPVIASLLDNELRKYEGLGKPSIGSALAGKYRLQHWSYNVTPWGWLAQGTADANKNLADDLSAILKAAKSASDIFHTVLDNTKGDGLSASEKLLLYRLAIFSGDFSKSASRSVYQEQLLDEEDQKRFECEFDRLCLSNTVVYSAVSHPMSFRLEPEWRDTILSLPEYELQKAEAIKNYFSYIGREIQLALEYHRRDPHSVDTGEKLSFSRLSPEAFTLSGLLTDVWAMLEEERNQKFHQLVLPLPELKLTLEEAKDLPDLNDALSSFGVSPDTSKGHAIEVKKRIFLVRLCANLALFWEANGLSGSGIVHLLEAEKLANDLLDLDLVEEKTFRRQVKAMRAQLTLSKIHMEVMQRRNTRSANELDDMAQVADKELRDIATVAGSNERGAGYAYGEALALLIKGMRDNRKISNKGIEDISKVIDDAAKVAGKNELDKPVGDSLLMAHDRQPVARFLTFTAAREKARSELRSGDMVAAINTGKQLLEAAMFVREPRLISDALVGLIHGYWFQFALGADRPFSSEQLQAIRKLLFQIGPFVEETDTDQSALRGHQRALSGIYNLEKSMAARSGMKDWITGRDRLGEQLFTSGISLIADSHYKGFYYGLLADAFYRFGYATKPERILVRQDEYAALSVDSTDTIAERLAADKGGVDVDPYAISAACLIRSLYHIAPEQKLGFGLSEILRQIYKRIYCAIGEGDIETACIIYAKTQRLDNTKENEKQTERSDRTEDIMKFLAET